MQLSLSATIEIATWRKWGIEKSEAYQFALLLEGGIIEDRLFIFSEGDSEETKTVFYEMRAGTNSHFKRLQAEYEKNDISAGFVKHLKAKFKSLF